MLKILTLSLLALLSATGISRAAYVGQEAKEKIAQAEKLGADGELEKMDEILLSLRHDVPSIDVIRREGYAKGIAANMDLATSNLGGYFGFQSLSAAYFAGKYLVGLSNPAWPMSKTDRQPLIDYFARELRGIIRTMAHFADDVKERDRSALVDIRSFAKALDIKLEVPPSLKLLSSPKASFDDEKVMNDAMSDARSGKSSKMEKMLSQISHLTTPEELEMARSVAYSTELKDIFNQADSAVRRGRIPTAHTAYRSALRFFKQKRKKVSDQGENDLAELVENRQKSLLSLVEDHVETANKINQNAVSKLVQNVVTSSLPTSLEKYVSPTLSSLATSHPSGEVKKKQGVNLKVKKRKGS